MTQALRFDGRILGVGTTSGARFVVGMWAATPFGAIVDVMVQFADGRRVLVAPAADVADFIAGTYTFDEVRVEPTHLVSTGAQLHVTSPSVDLTVDVGARSRIGWLLRAVPPPLTRSRWWCRLIDPVARRLRPGVRTHGSAGNGRHEFYCARDEHAVVSARVTWEGRDLGPMARLDPPVSFGFGSAPKRPSLIGVTTLIDEPARQT